MADIPPLILVSAGFERYVLLQTKCVKGGYLKSCVLNKPGTFIGAGSSGNSGNSGSSGSWRNDGIRKLPFRCEHIRESHGGDSLNEYYTNTMTQTTLYFDSPRHGKIFVYDVTTPNLVLPDRFYDVYNGKDKKLEWHFVKSASASVATARATPAQQPIQTVMNPLRNLNTAKTIPTHIFKAFVEMAISKKETCSITMDELTLGNVGMTPCGHLFDKSALITALTKSNKCPQCRAPATSSQIQA